MRVFSDLMDLAKDRTKDGPPIHERVVGHRMGFFQVLLNLTTNAIKFAEEAKETPFEASDNVTNQVCYRSVGVEALCCQGEWIGCSAVTTDVDFSRHNQGRNKKDTYSYFITR